MYKKIGNGSREQKNEMATQKVELMLMRVKRKIECAATTKHAFAKKCTSGCRTMDGCDTACLPVTHALDPDPVEFQEDVKYFKLNPMVYDQMKMLQKEGPANFTSAELKPILALPVSLSMLSTKTWTSSYRKLTNSDKEEVRDLLTIARISLVPPRFRDELRTRLS